MKKIDNYKRMELFNHYNSCDNPFIIVTIPVKVTNLVNYCKINKNFYATMGYIITKTVNEVEEFRYRVIYDEIYYCDKIDSNYTQRKDELIGFYDVNYSDDYDLYLKNYKDTENKFINNEKCLDNRSDVIWLSCSPWFTFTSLVTPFNKKTTIPQFIWDKYVYKDNDYYLNLMIMIHHGFCDGSHVAKFIDNLNKNIESFKNNI